MGRGSGQGLILGAFRFEPELDKPEKRRPLIFDTERYDATSENSMEKLRRLYKTTDRRIYDEAGLRGGECLSSDVVFIHEVHGSPNLW